MRLSLENRVRHEILRYVQHEITLASFEEWLVGATWSQLDPTDASLVHLVGAVELTLAEYSSGHWTEDEVRAHLQEAITHDLAIQTPGQATA
jgi:hypothetical protein